MKVIYVSCLCSKHKFEEISRSSSLHLSQAAQKYHRLLAEGFAQNDGVEIETVTALPITRKSSRNIYIKKQTDIENGVKYNYLSIINIPIIKNISTIILSFFKTLKLCDKNKNNIIVCDVLNMSVSIGALLAARIKKLNNIGIVTDIPSFLNNNSKSLSVKINNYLINSFKSYVFLTEAMSDIIDCKNKKYIVIEGHVDKNMKDIDNLLESKYEKKVCIYAGGLHKIYGIEYLTKAFIKANISNAELHIYGNGDFQDELQEICKKYSNIKYFGVKPNDYIVQEELKATLLINPRPTNEEYTKYSFPSKNMEYMVSGTPVLTTKLSGMPKEYEKYVYLIEEETVSGLIKNLRFILEKTPNELYDYGLKCKKFVLREKNNIVQARKICSMIEENRNGL